MKSKERAEKLLNKSKVPDPFTSELQREMQWLLEEKYLGEKSRAFFTDCERLEAGEPLAYVIGHVPFLGTKIFLDSHPLIPRTETEFWVEKVIGKICDQHINQREGATFPQAPPTWFLRSLATIKTEMPLWCDRKPLRKGSPSRFLRALDLCAGSGCIGVAVLKQVPGVRVDFAEIDSHHHATILKNIQENGIEEKRMRIFDGDLFENIPPDTLYDYILTNPPYIDPTLAGRTAKDVKKYEPHLALCGGKDGMEYIEKIITEAPTFLAPDGILFIEHEPEQAHLLAQKATECGYVKIEHHVDQYGVTRTSSLTYPQ